MANNPMASVTTKQIDVKHHYPRVLVIAKTIAVVSIMTSDLRLRTG
jgi:hypothetical protein